MEVGFSNFYLDPWPLLICLPICIWACASQDMVSKVPYQQGVVIGVTDGMKTEMMAPGPAK